MSNGETELEHELYAEPEVYEGEVFDNPNKQAVGLAPPWEEGTGGEEGEPAPQARLEEGGGEGTPAALDEMTKDELLEYARQRDISPANASMSKDEIRASIDEAES